MEVSRRYGDHDSSADYTWNPLSPEVRSRVLETKASLTSANKDDRIMSLNLYLMMSSTGIDQEHLRMTARRGNTCFYVQNPMWDNLNHTEPILDPRIINKSVIEGTFFQCIPLENDNGEFDIGYELRIGDLNGNQYVAIVPDNSVKRIEKRIDISESLAKEREASDIDKKLGECFKLLRKPKNKEFQNIVQDLSDVFYGDDTDGGDFCRDIGICATDLMNHPVIISNKDYLPALEYILRNAIDDDIPWYVEGFADDMVIRDNKVYPDNIRDVSLSHATLRGLTLLSPEIEKKDGTYISTGRMTPAYVFEHTIRGATERVTVPLMHIKGIYSDIRANWRVRYDEYVKAKPEVGTHLGQLALRRESERVRKYESRSHTA